MKFSCKSWKVSTVKKHEKQTLFVREFGHLFCLSTEVGKFWRLSLKYCYVDPGVTETFRNISSRVIERDTSGEIYFLEDSRGFRTCQHGREVTKLALPPRFRQVLIESPL
ncbi:hypothetical protein TNCV_1391341 [Trichonephila clavipes]|nr:hypothetical protein TNCV_1391341 [Trichonephila clavipes]